MELYIMRGKITTLPMLAIISVGFNKTCTLVRA